MPFVELIYSLSPPWWGRGLAVEAGSAVLDHVLTGELLDEVWAGFDPPNVRSSATLERLGFSSARNLFLDVGPTPYWRVTRTEWASLRR